VLEIDETLSMIFVTFSPVIVNKINFQIDNIFIEFGGRIFQQTVGIPLLADLFSHSYEAEFVKELLRKGERENSTVL